MAVVVLQLGVPLSLKPSERKPTSRSELPESGLVYDEERPELRDTMTHFRGQIRGPHWGPAMDNKLIDFWRRHECLFNSSASSYNDKNLKRKLWSEFALSVGKPGEPAGGLLGDDASSSGCMLKSEAL